MSSIDGFDGPLLLSIARQAIEARLDPARAEPHLAESPLGASFVTLTRRGELRGCIGSLEALRPLYVDVATNARNAAFKDPRFPPLTGAEWPEVSVEVSVLGSIEWQECAGIEEARDWIRTGRDGVVLASGGRRATFLPQVWESLPQPLDFLGHLLHKAGLGQWPANARIGRYPIHKYRGAAAETAS